MIFISMIKKDLRSAGGCGMIERERKREREDREIERERRRR